jgi:hypothetical protein
MTTTKPADPKSKPLPSLPSKLANKNTVASSPAEKYENGSEGSVKSEEGRPGEEEEEEDDYMSMTILEPEKPKWKKETYSEIRRKREREVC